MADYFVDSGASGANDGSTKADAYTSFATAISGKAAGDRFLVSHTHSQNFTADQTLNLPGTLAAPNILLSINFSDDTVTAGATITSNLDLDWLGNFYAEGFHFAAGLSTTSLADVMTFANQTTSPDFMYFRNCTLNGQTTNAGGHWKIGVAAASTAQGCKVVFDACTFRFQNAGHSIDIFTATANFVNCTDLLNVADAVPTNFLTLQSNLGSKIVVRGCDLTDFTASQDFIAINGVHGPHYIDLVGCRLGADFSLYTGTWNSKDMVIRMTDCDDGTEYFRTEKYEVAGGVMSNTTNTRDNSDAPCSLEMDTSLGGAAPSFHDPLLTDWIEQYAAAASLTATGEFIHDSATALQNDEIWLEVEYEGNASYPLRATANDRVATIVTSPADQASSSEVWTESLTNDNEQAAVVAFTPLANGQVLSRFALNKATYVAFVDPDVVLT